ncbi:MAG: hypothetical protein HQK58_12825, partial [Deltaproteobacteria bacterium]|nr:hypothetical protein [Deltaproteobacteria bacterium]
KESRKEVESSSKEEEPKGELAKMIKSDKIQSWISQAMQRPDEERAQALINLIGGVEQKLDAAPDEEFKAKTDAMVKSIIPDSPLIQNINIHKAQDGEEVTFEFKMTKNNKEDIIQAIQKILKAKNEMSRLFKTV